MEHAVFITDGIISLSEYLPCDYRASYECWLDPETQDGYNMKYSETYEQFISDSSRIKSGRFSAVIIRNSDNMCVGEIGLSPEGMPPDLAIRMYKPSRRQGYGTMAFALGAEYCLKTFDLDRIYADCYPHNKGSMKMLERCGFVPHPEGNIPEKHYITGEDIIQYDYVKYNHHS